MLSQSRSTRRLEEGLPASDAYDVLGSFVLFFSVSVKGHPLAIFRNTYRSQLRLFCSNLGIFGIAITLRGGFGSLLPCGKPEKRIDIQGEPLRYPWWLARNVTVERGTLFFSRFCFLKKTPRSKFFFPLFAPPF